MGTTFHRLFLTFVFFLACSSCRREEHGNELSSSFENAKRRLVTIMESKALVRLTPRLSAGFYLKNKSGQIVVMTARHTLLSTDKLAQPWCEKEHFIDTATLIKFPCERVLFDDPRSDTIMFIAKKPAGLDPDGLELSGFDPNADLPLAMMGFPKDSVILKDYPEAFKPQNGYIPGAYPAITNQCWVVDPLVKGASLQDGIDDAVFSHNCTVYSGNSGGPMLIDGSNLVVGMPVTYTKQTDTESIPKAEHLALAARMSDFVRLASSVLNDVGVRIVRSHHEIWALKAEFHRNTRAFIYREPKCMLNAFPIFTTRAHIARIFISTKPRTEPGCQVIDTFNCNADRFCWSSKGTRTLRNFGDQTLQLSENGIARNLAPYIKPQPK